RYDRVVVFFAPRRGHLLVVVAKYRILHIGSPAVSPPQGRTSMANTDMGAASTQVRNDPLVKFALRSTGGGRGGRRPILRTVLRKTRWLVFCEGGRLDRCHLSTRDEIPRRRGVPRPSPGRSGRRPGKGSTRRAHMERGLARETQPRAGSRHGGVIPVPCRRTHRGVVSYYQPCLDQSQQGREGRLAGSLGRTFVDNRALDRVHDRGEALARNCNGRAIVTHWP